MGLKKIIFLLLGLLLVSPGPVSAANTGYNGSTAGYLLQIETDPVDQSVRVDIEEYSGQKYHYLLEPGAVMQIDTIPVEKEAFQPGIEVYGRVVNGKLVYLEGYSTAVTGYVQPGSIVRKGTIIKIKGDQLTLLMANGEENVYRLSPVTLVSKMGGVADPDILCAGDRVKLYFDQLNSDLISRMEIEGNSILIKNIYHGNLQYTDEIRNSIILSAVKRFREGKWQDVQAMIELADSYDMTIYAGGYPIPAYQLKYYQKNEVYAITRDQLGKETIERFILKNRNESIYSGKIEDINWYTQELELSNHMNFSFRDGTSIIKNRRLQNAYVLSTGQDVSIIADGLGNERSASLIQILNEDINNSSIGKHYLYAGQVDQISLQTLWLKDYYILEENEWERYRRPAELFYDQDTYFYDFDENRVIDSQEFLAGDYAVDEDTDRVEELELEDKYAYLYTDGDRAAAVGLCSDLGTLSGQRITCGTVQTVTEDALAGWIIQLYDVKDWSAHREQWMVKDSGINLNLSQAMIIKNGEMIQADQLDPGDYLFIVRDDYTGKIILVK